MAAVADGAAGSDPAKAEFNPFAGRSLRIALGLDGSKIAKHAADVVLALVGNHAGDDKVDTVTITDSTKTYLPYDMRPSTISDWAEVHFVSRLARKQYEINLIPKRSGESTRDALLRTVNSTDDPAFDLLCVGMVGRKGPKDDVAVMGSTADVALRGARCATLIAKSAKIKEGKPHVFMICVDGSKAAKKAVNLACGVAGPKDTVVIVHAVDRSSQPTIGKPFRAAAVKASFATLVESDSRVKYEEIDDDNSEPISELLSDHAYDLECDFLVMGADGMGSFIRGQAHFGSVTEALIGKARCHVLVTKEEGKKYPIKTSSEYQLGFIGRGVDRVDTGGGSAGEAAVAKGKGPPAGGTAASEDAEGGDPGAKEEGED